MSELKTIKIDAHLHQLLKIEAAKRGVQLKDLINQILREWLEREAEEG